MTTTRIPILDNGDQLPEKFLPERLSEAGVASAIEAQLASEPAVVDAAEAAVATAFVNGGIVTISSLPELQRNRVTNPQGKGSTFTNPSSTSYIQSEITTGLPSGAMYGRKSIRQGANSTVVADLRFGSTTVDTAREIMVTPGEVISAGIMVWTNDPAVTTARCTLRFFKEDGTASSITPSINGTSSTLAVSVWQLRTILNKIVPSDAVRVVVNPVISAVTSTTGAESRATMANVISGASYLPYGDGDQQLWEWSGTPHASQSVKIFETQENADALAIMAPYATELATLGEDGLVVRARSKNLYNPNDPDVLNDQVPTTGSGTYIPLANYRTSGYIVVDEGTQYTVSNFRYWEWFDSDRLSQGEESNTGINTAVQTLTVPVGASYLRVTHNYVSAPLLQVEKGAAATSYEAYFDTFSLTEKMEDAVLAVVTGDASQVTLSKTSTAVSITSTVADQPLVVNAVLDGSANGAFNFVDVSHGGVGIVTNDDDVTPIRTQMGTVGGNHGFSCTAGFDNPDGKDTIDLGSVWTDGTREYVLLSITDGLLVMGGSYTGGTGLTPVTSANVSPTVNLTHVSGATHTGEIVHTTLTPKHATHATRITVQAFVDGERTTADGTYEGVEVEVRESYEIMDYKSLYDLAKANVGIPYKSLEVEGAVLINNVFVFGGSGRCRVTTMLDELKPTTLAGCGAVQAIRPTKTDGTTYRYLPGVGVVGGFDWTNGVDMTSYATSVNITTSDLLVATAPPAFSLDVIEVSGEPVIGFALGYLPFGSRSDSASRNARRLTAASTKLWDLRSTKKSYPNFTLAESVGWNHFQVDAYRCYLSPSVVDQVLASKSNALAAFSALDAAIKLT